MNRERLHKVARYYTEKLNVSVLPLMLNDKRPATSWERWQDVKPTVEEIASWDAGNLGLATGPISGIVVVDCESRKDAEWFWDTHGKTQTVVRTPRGYHLYFRQCKDMVGNAAKVKDDKGQPRYDVRGYGGYVVCPPSEVDGKSYEFCFGWGMKPVEELTEFNPEWMPKNGYGGSPNESRVIRNGMAYIKTMRAVSGAGGHNETYKAVCRLKDSGMCETEALAAMVEWNATNADPPWTTAELLHKVRDAYRNGG